VEASKNKDITMDRAERVKKILEQLDGERLKNLQAALDSNMDTEFQKRAEKIDAMGKESVERLQKVLEYEGVLQDQYGIKKGEWTPKRIAWAIVSIVGGSALAYLMQKKLPAMNHAASGVTGGLVFENLGLRGQKSFIGNAAGGLAGTWLNQNCQMGEVALAAPAFAFAIFGTGEDIVSAYEQVRAQRAAAEKAKTEGKK
jgi:hypothetical protein